MRSNFRYSSIRKVDSVARVTPYGSDLYPNPAPITFAAFGTGPID